MDLSHFVPDFGVAVLLSPDQVLQRDAVFFGGILTAGLCVFRPSKTGPTTILKPTPLLTRVSAGFLELAKGLLVRGQRVTTQEVFKSGGKVKVHSPEEPSFSRRGDELGQPFPVFCGGGKPTDGLFSMGMPETFRMFASKRGPCLQQGFGPGPSLEAFGVEAFRLLGIPGVLGHFPAQEERLLGPKSLRDLFRLREVSPEVSQSSLGGLGLQFVLSGGAEPLQSTSQLGPNLLSSADEGGVHGFHLLQIGFWIRGRARIGPSSLFHPEVPGSLQIALVACEIQEGLFDGKPGFGGVGQFGSMDVASGFLLKSHLPPEARQVDPQGGECPVHLLDLLRASFQSVQGLAGSLTLPGAPALSGGVQEGTTLAIEPHRVLSPGCVAFGAGP
jgi:hypothetical protein